LNTVILLTSGATVTWAHHAIVSGAKKSAQTGLFLTIILAIIFTALQVYEYLHAPFTISDGIYGSTFFMATGFHGFHVFSGVVINVVVYIMTFRGVFERRGHYEMIEKAGLYWHFVDLVWVFVFTFFYLI
jgi:cytochrome c oxidase subunit 3